LEEFVRDAVVELSPREGVAREQLARL
jgi:hypothetical protein